MKPMLLNDAGLDPDSLKMAITDDSFVVQQKVDGQRVLVECNPRKVTYYNRKGDEITLNGGFTNYFSRFENVVFDGEFLNGVFWVFDEFPVDNPHAMTLDDRLDNLKHLIDETNTVRILPTAYAAEEKRDLIRAVIKSRGEGVVLKDLNTRYYPGERLNFKYKFYNDLDVVVSSLHEVKASANIVVYDPQGNPVELGSVSAPPWVAINDVLIVKYLYATDEKRLYQPTLIQRRTDKLPEECTVDQLRYTNRSVIDHDKIAELT